MGAGAILRAHIAALDAKILEHQSILEQLETNRRAVHLELQSLTYPVLTLPPEITSEIFIHCLPDEPERPRKSHAPLLFFAVCKAWKTIALSVPDLWTTLYLDVDRLRVRMPNPDTRSQSIIRSWFDRAGNLPLTLILCGWVAETFVEDNCVNEIIHYYASRWRRLDLRMEEEDFSAVDESGSFPLLQELTIGPRRFHFHDQVMIRAGVFKEMPMLRRITLMEGVVPPFIAISWQHLTVFHGGMLSLSACLAVLHLSPLLTHCTFAARQTHAPYDGGVLSHPSLLFLSLKGSRIEVCTAAIFQYITLPSLHTLRITGVIHDLDNGNSFQSFISRSSPPLRSFSLGGYLSTSFRPRSLRCLTTIADLELQSVEDLFAYLLLQLLVTDGKAFLPHLQNITFTECKFSLSTYPKLAQFLRSRWTQHEGVAALQSCKITWPRDNLTPYLDDATLLPLKELAAAGASVHIGPPEQNLLSF
ncbi:hypothetical protein B0H11DRAFT_237058 [Mycena galericulata]|nr:hypothetical protein B0H11DRAFT_237058 [Mycena galericulata]